MLKGERRQECERQIVRATIEAALARGYTLHSVANGEDDERVASTDEAMKYAFECDEAHIFFTRPNAAENTPISWLFIVLGNEGWTVISDYTVDLDDAVNDTEELVTKWEEEDARC